MKPKCPTMARFKQKRRVTAAQIAWCRGYSWASKSGYDKLRDCRLIAMGFEQGFKYGHRKQKRED